jgi:hypothetical protein
MKVNKYEETPRYDTCSKNADYVKKRHDEAHELKSDERYPCSECDYRATSKGYLTKHEKAVHEDILTVNVTTKHMKTMRTIK